VQDFGKRPEQNIWQLFFFLDPFLGILYFGGWHAKAPYIVLPWPSLAFSSLIKHTARLPDSFKKINLA
jgi:hypothetical protein